MPPMTNFTRSCLAIAVGQAMVVGNATAATVAVNTNLDTGTTNACTLRSAIALINNQSGNAYLGCTADVSISVLGTADEVVFDLPVGQETITLDGTSLTIASTVSINPDYSPGIVIDANEQSRALQINGGASDTIINGLTITGGSASGVGGGIYLNNANNVSLTNSVVTANTSTGVGGGIYVRDAVSFSLLNSSVSQNSSGIYLRYCTQAAISDSTISQNTATGNGAGINLFRSYSTNVDRTKIINNSALGGNTGGGLYAYESENISLIDTLISDNSASDGGGIYLVISDGLSILKSTIDNNYSSNKGGGLSTYNSKGLSIVNSTVSNNSAPADKGGAVYLDSTSVNSKIIQSTIVENTAYLGGGLYSMSSIDLTNTVVASNISNDSSNDDCNTNIVGVDLANWIGDGSCNNGGAQGDPKLGSLGDNGGVTPTHNPLPNSGLIKAGDITSCIDAPVNGLDQRGEDRTAPECSIGSVEFISEQSFFVVPIPGGKSVVFSL